MLIDYQNVSIYQADKCVLQNINFHIDEGEFAYLIGKVGSGKSSLLKTLYCELDLVEGETEKAEILGRDLKTIRRKEIPALRKELGIIFQDFQLLHDRTVRKNFEFVLKATGWKNKKHYTLTSGKRCIYKAKPHFYSSDINCTYITMKIEQ